MKAGADADREDPYDLNRFLAAQEGVYDVALKELRSARKRSHWMWFVFPQILGLGSSATTIRYSIKCREEALQYLKHPVLGMWLQECADAILAIKERSAFEVLGSPDDIKLKSSMTLFASVAEPGSVFNRVLDQYFGGVQDSRTFQLLGGN